MLHRITPINTMQDNNTRHDTLPNGAMQQKRKILSRVVAISSFLPISRSRSGESGRTMLFVIFQVTMTIMHECIRWFPRKIRVEGTSSLFDEPHDAHPHLVGHYFFFLLWIHTNKTSPSPTIIKNMLRLNK